MLRCTFRRFVVFTQGYPLLECFAREHFLPSNPMSSSCLWLDEDDFRGIKIAALAKGRPFPLQIDPYAHHPVLSRFAPKPTSRRTTTAAGSCRPPSTATAVNPGEVESVLQSAEAAPQLGQHANGGVQHDELATPRRRRGRPRKASAPTVPAVSEGRVTAADLSQYQVPIVSLSVTKPLYLCNLDQMFLSMDSSHQWQSNNSGSTKDKAEDSLLFGSSLVCSAKPDDASSSPELLNGAGSSAKGADLTLFPSLNSEASSFLSSRPLLNPSREELLLGTQELQRRFPTAVNMGASLMYSVQTRQPYGRFRQRDLQRLAEKHGYRSKWWGTRKQWFAVGAQLRPGQYDHVVPVSFFTKLVHISLIENAAEVLKQSWVSARHRRLMYIFSEWNEGVRGDASEVMMSGVVMSRQDSLSRPSFPPRHTPPASFFDALQRQGREDMERMHFKLPLYLSRRQIASLGLSLRPDAQGILGSQLDVPLGAADDDDSDDATQRNARESLQLPPALAKTSTTTFRYWYHLSQVHFPASYLLSSTVLSAEMANPGVALHGTTGAPLPHPELSYAALVDHHPDIAAVLLAGDGDGAVTASAASQVPHSEAPADAGKPISSIVPPLSGGSETPVADGDPRGEPQEPSEPFDELSIARFVATHASPRLVQGRHLWFQAEDVLLANGIVNVNSAPVEIKDVRHTNKRIAGGILGDVESEDPSDKRYYNVELLTDPDEALRKMSQPFDAM